MRYRKNKNKEALQNKMLILIPMSISMILIPAFISWVSNGGFALAFLITSPFVMLTFYGIHKWLMIDEE